jgi:GNAT superfamily N-acetyltransferase
MGGESAAMENYPIKPDWPPINSVAFDEIADDRWAFSVAALGVGHISGERGWTRFNGTEQIFEADTFYIEDVTVNPEARRERSGYSKSLLAAAIDEARKREFKLARLVITDPYLLGTVEAMLSAGLVRQVAYVPKQLAATPEEDVDMASEAVLSSDQRINRQEAEAKLREFLRQSDEEKGSIICMMEL